MIAVYELRATELILIIALLLPAVINGWDLWIVFKGRKRNRKLRKYPVLPEQSSKPNDADKCLSLPVVEFGPSLGRYLIRSAGSIK
jgi:hypothetical protein